jgi:hypothetical protein
VEPGWTEIVRSDEEITDPVEGRRLMESRIAERGIQMDAIDLAADIEIRQWLVRRPGDGSRHCVYEYLFRDEVLRGSS